MKIAIFTDFFIPVVGGLVTSLEQLILELDRQGHEILVIAPTTNGGPTHIGERGRLEYVPSVSVFFYPSWRLGLLSRKLNNSFKNFAPDIVLAASPANVGMMGIFLAKFHHIPVVASFHGYFMKPEYLKLVGIKKGVRFFEAMGWMFLRFIYRPCKVIISPSTSVRTDLLAHHFSNPVVVCPNGLLVNTEAINIKEYERLKNSAGLDSRKTFLYLGRLSVEKNLLMLLKVFQSVNKKNPDTRLLIVGGGPAKKKELEEVTHQYKLDGKIVFLGEFTHDDLFKLGIFKLASVFVTCSTSEVQPMSMIEALFYGLPIITTLSQGMSDLVEDEKNGYLVKSDSVAGFTDKWLKIIEDDKLYQEFSMNAKKMSERFTVQNSAEAYLSVFNKVVSGERIT